MIDAARRGCYTDTKQRPCRAAETKGGYRNETEKPEYSDRSHFDDLGRGAGAHFDVYLRQRPGQLPGGAGDGDDPAGRGLCRRAGSLGDDPGRADRGDAGDQGTLSILLGLGAALNVVKIVVGVLGIRKAAEPATFFVVWGAVLLLLGVLGMMFSGVTSVLGLCDLAGGVFGPAFFLWGGVQNKRAFQRMLKEEREAEEQAAESAWPPVRKG